MKLRSAAWRLRWPPCWGQVCRPWRFDQTTTTTTTTTNIIIVIIRCCPGVLPNLQLQARPLSRQGPISTRRNIRPLENRISKALIVPAYGGRRGKLLGERPVRRRSLCDVGAQRSLGLSLGPTQTGPGGHDCAIPTRDRCGFGRFEM